jgi:hypothetical protein
MNKPIRTGTMIALTAATLFAAACTKAKEAPPPSDKTETKEAAKPGMAAPTATATPATTPPEKTAKVHCGNVNGCKGQSSCKTAKNACSGQNGCKGEGYVELTAEECQTKGGKVLADK